MTTTFSMPAFTDEMAKIAAAKKKNKKNIVLTGAGVGGLGGIVAQDLSYATALPSIRNGRAMTPEEAEAFKQYHAKHIPDVKVVPGIRVKDSAGRARLVTSPMYAPDHKIIVAPKTAHPAILAHEMGHASGLGRHTLTGLTAGLAHMGRSLGPAIGAGAGALLAPWAMRGKTEDERDDRLKKLQIGVGAGGAAALPLIAEEGRASLRAVNLGRQTGRGLEYARHLLPAFGTYVALPAGLTAGAMYGLHKMRQANKKKT